MIISASRRTDIPRFYSEWLIQRLRAGFCLVPNPYNPRQKSHVDLRPQAVSAIVFWTRYPGPLLKYLDEISAMGFPFYFQFTLNNYPALYEKNAVDLSAVLDSFTRLAQKIGPQRIIWRYDPIFFSHGLEPDFHIKNIKRLCQQLQGCTNHLIISLLDEYRKTKKQLINLNCGYQGDPIKHPFLQPFIKDLVSLATVHHLTISACAEPLDLTFLGITQAQCIDASLLNKIGYTRLLYKKDPNQRSLCRCMISKDIGVNQTCPGGCVYCYASGNQESVRRNLQNHDPANETI